MRLAKSLLSFFLLLLGLGLHANTAPLVSGVLASQRTDGSKIVDIYYSVVDADADTLSVSITVSNDNGLSFSVNPSTANLSGDFGDGIVSGTNKHIIWNAGAEVVNFLGSSFRVKVTATEMLNLTRGLIAFFPFNGNANDASGFNNHGTVYGAVPSVNRFNLPNSSYYFNEGNYIRVNNTSILNPDFVTMCAWVKFQSGGTWSPRIISKVTDAVNNVCTGYEIYTLTTASSRSPSMRIGINDIDYRIENTQEIAANEWHFIAGSYDGSILSIYTDGVLVDTLVQAGLITPNSIDLYIGKISRSNDDLFVGNIDDIRIYNRALSANEVIALYQEGGWPISK